MTIYRATAWKYPVVSASADIEADNLNDAIAKAKTHDWDSEPMEDASDGDYGPIIYLRVENENDDEDEQEIDLEPLSPREGIALAALAQAEGFISGFEGDETQEGIDQMLTLIRDAIRAFEIAPALIDPTAEQE